MALLNGKTAAAVSGDDAAGQPAGRRAEGHRHHGLELGRRGGRAKRHGRGWGHDAPLRGLAHHLLEHLQTRGGRDGVCKRQERIDEKGQGREEGNRGGNPEP